MTKVEKLKRNNYAWLDLIMGVVLLLAIMFPSTLGFLVDLKLTAFLGLLFLFLLIAGRGFGVIIVVALLEILKKTVNWVGFGAAARSINKLMALFVISLFSVVEGIILLAISFIVIILPVTFVSPSIVQGVISYYENDKVIASIAVEIARILSCCSKADPQTYVLIIVLSVVVSAFSCFSIFLYKAIDFSLLKWWISAKSNIKAGTIKHEKEVGSISTEKAEQLEKRERATLEFIEKVYTDMKNGTTDALETVLQDESSA
jgi:hypothetical protein